MGGDALHGAGGEEADGEGEEIGGGLGERDAGQAKDGVERDLGDEQQLAAGDDERVLIEEQNQRAGEEDAEELDQERHHEGALEDEADALVEAGLVFGAEGVGGDDGVGIGQGAAAILVSEEATDRQIWMTAVGMPMRVTVLMRLQLGRKALRRSLMTERSER